MQVYRGKPQGLYKFTDENPRVYASLHTDENLRVYTSLHTDENLRVYTSLHTDENPQGLYKFTYR
jgi:hypothetical protein